MSEKLVNSNLLLSSDKLNSFTEKLKEILESEEMKGSTLVVRTRDNFLMEVESFKDDEDGIGFEGHFGNRTMFWEADGSSVTSRDYDIIEIVQ